MPTGIAHQPDHLRSSGRHARKNKYLTTGSLQDRDVPIDMLIRNIKGDANDNHASQIAETLLNSLVKIATELIVLPKDHNLAFRIKCLDVIGVDAPLGAVRRLPAHRPGKRLGVAQLLVAGGNEELGNLPLIQEAPDGKVSGRAEGAKHQEDIFPLDQPTGHIERNGGIRIVVIGDEAHLAAVYAAALVDHVEIRRLGFSDRGKFRQWSRIVHEIANTDFLIVV